LHRIENDAVGAQTASYRMAVALTLR
jgi:hypothetical protein